MISATGGLVLALAALDVIAEIGWSGQHLLAVVRGQHPLVSPTVGRWHQAAPCAMKSTGAKAKGLVPFQPPGCGNPEKQGLPRGAHSV